MTGFKRILYFLFFTVSFHYASGQGDAGSMLKPFQLKQFGKNAERVGDIYSAIDYYERYCRAKPGNFKVAYRLAEVYRAARDYNVAGEWYLKCYKGQPEKFTQALFYYAQMLKTQGEYEQAKWNFKKFKKEYRGQKNYREFSKLLKVEMQGCDMAKMMIDTPLKVAIVHIDTSINKAHIEFSPLPVNDSLLIYASFKADSIQYYSANDSIRKPVRKFYTASKTSTKQFGKGWKGGKPLEGPFNDPDMHTGNGAFSPDGKRFYFTRCKKNWQNKMVCSIYLSKKVEDKWQLPEKLGKHINHPKYTSTQPTVGTESKRNWEVLYFVSNRPGGKGGMDIWYTIYDKRRKEYKQPKNAGSKINTVGDELSPFFDIETRKMYFSSNGLPGIGGLDMFRTIGEQRRWSSPENIGYPLNSGADDLHYILNKEKEEGFFVSNREGGVALKNETCCDDIYAFKLLEFIHVAVTGKIFEMDCKEIESLESKTGKQASNDFVISDISKKVLKDAQVSLYLIDDETAELIYINIEETDIRGDYYFFKLDAGRNYRLIISKEGYFNKQIDIPTHHLTFSDTIRRDAGLCKIPLEPIVVKNIYYPFDKFFLTDEAKVTIDTTLFEILNNNPNIIIELSSHTDSKGTDAYNQKLSQKRAESVVKYLISNGIEANRLVAKGYGESKPIVPNTLPDGSDNPDGRAKNRRTEFRVIGTLLHQYSGIIYED